MPNWEEFKSAIESSWSLSASAGGKSTYEGSAGYNRSDDAKHKGLGSGRGEETGFDAPSFGFSAGAGYTNHAFQATEKQVSVGRDGSGAR